MEQGKSWRKILLYAIVIAFCIALIASTTNMVFTFDAGLSFKLSRLLTQEGLQSYFFDQESGSVPLGFTAQTGIPVTFPTAFFNYFFGVDQWHMILVSMLYMCGFLLLVGWYIKRKCGWYVAAIGVLLVIVTPNFYSIASDAYGEISMGFWMLAGILFLFKARRSGEGKHYFSSGACMTLGLFTKTVFVSCLPVLMIFFLLDAIFAYRAGKLLVLFRHLLIFVIGAILVAAFLELTRLYGFGYDEYVKWWSAEVNAVLRHSGVQNGYFTLTGIEKIQHHLNLYMKSYGLSPLRVCLLYGVPLIYYLLRVRPSTIRRYYDELFIYGISCTYFVWWVAILSTQKAWYRHILLGHSFAMTIFVIVVGREILRILSVSRTRRAGIFFTVVGLASTISFIGVNGMKLYEQQKDAVVKAHATREFVEKINTLPENSVLFGYEWWMNPVIEALSGKKFHDFKKEGPFIPKNSYFVMDYYASSLAKDSLLSSLYFVDLLLVYENGGNRLYEMRGKKPPKDMPAKREYDLKKMFESGDPIAKYVAGAYGIESEGAFFWATNDIFIYMKNESGAFLLRGYWPQLPDNVPEMTLSICVNEHAVEDLVIKSGQSFSIAIGKDVIERYVHDSENYTVRISTEYSYSPLKYGAPDGRHLAYLVTYIGQGEN